MPRFTVKDVLTGTAIVACGLATAMFARNVMYYSEDISLAPPMLGSKGVILLGLWAAGCATAGAGLLYPVKKVITGIVIGLIVATALVLMDLMHLLI